MSDLQRIELKVSVGCCDACKRKVKKRLQRVEGVCRTEIDGEKGKVVVHSYTGPEVLISRLMRVGKYAELISSGKPQNPENEKKEEKAVSTKEEKPKPKPRPENHPSSCNSKEDKQNTMNCNMRTDTSLKINDENKENKNEMRCTDAQILKNESVVSTPEVKFMPYLVPVPCYAMPQYAIPLPQTIHSQGYYQAPEMPVYMHQPQQVARFGDYFSEENTVGCNVM